MGVFGSYGRVDQQHRRVERLSHQCGLRWNYSLCHNWASGWRYNASCAGSTGFDQRDASERDHLSGNNEAIHRYGALSGLTADLTKSVQWTSSVLSAATINANGLATGMPMPKGSGLAGQTTLTASLSTVSNTAVLAVTPIQHIIIMVQENRSTDSLFQHGFIARGADIAQSGLDSKGNVIQLQQIPLVTGWGGAHEVQTFNQSYDNGKMDGFDLVSICCNPAKCNTIPPNPMYSYVNPSDIGPYFQMAEQYVFAEPDVPNQRILKRVGPPTCLCSMGPLRRTLPATCS